MLEDRVNQLCEVILKADSENWDMKNKAVLQLIESFRPYENADQATISEAFTPELFRHLKEPIKQLIVDLRSQQVRDTCQLLIELARICGDRLKSFLRDAFPHILEGIKVPNKVMTNYVDECILTLIRYTIFKSGILPLVQEIRDNKSKFVREKCIEYIHEIFQCWDLTEKEIDPIGEAIKVCLEDASGKAREVARNAYLLLYRNYPRKAERLRQDLPKALQTKLMNAEVQFSMNSSADSENSSNHSSSYASNSHTPTKSAKSTTSTNATTSSKISKFPSSSNTPSNTSNGHQHHHHRPVSVPHTPVSATSSSSSTHTSNHPLTGTRRPISIATTALHPHHHQNHHVSHLPHHSQSTSAVQSSSLPPTPSNPIPPYPLSSSKSTTDSYTSGTKIATMSSVDQAALAIQAGVRNALSRRRSVVKNPFAELSETFSSTSKSLDHQSVATDPLSSSSTSHTLPTTSYLSSELYYDPPLTAGIHSDLSPYIPEEGNPKEKKLPQAVLPDNNQATEKVRRLSLSDKYPQHLSLNMKASIALSKDRKVFGTIRFIGHTLFAPGIWIGCELTTPEGKNNGSVQGHYYFSCPMHYGLFIREEYVTPLPSSSSFPSIPAEAIGTTNTEIVTSSSGKSTPTVNPITAIRNEVKKSQPVEPNPPMSSHAIRDRTPVRAGNYLQDQVPDATKEGNENLVTMSSSEKSNPGKQVTIASTSSPPPARLQSFTDNMTVFSGISEANFSYHSSATDNHSNTSNSTKRAPKSASILKMKLSKMMELLNQQLELVEVLESEEKTHPLSQNVLVLRKEIHQLSQYELETLESFQATWKDFPKLS